MFIWCKRWVDIIFEFVVSEKKELVAEYLLVKISGYIRMYPPFSL